MILYLLQIRITFNPTAIHQHNTRNKDVLHIFAFSNTFGSKTLAFKGCKLWNDLPDAIKSQPSLLTFLKSPEVHLRNKYFDK